MKSILQYARPSAWLHPMSSLLSVWFTLKSITCVTKYTPTSLSFSLSLSLSLSLFLSLSLSLSLCKAHTERHITHTHTHTHTHTRSIIRTLSEKYYCFMSFFFATSVPSMGIFCDVCFAFIFILCNDFFFMTATPTHPILFHKPL